MQIRVVVQLEIRGRMCIIARTLTRIIGVIRENGANGVLKATCSCGLWEACSVLWMYNTLKACTGMNAYDTHRPRWTGQGSRQLHRHVQVTRVEPWHEPAASPNNNDRHAQAKEGLKAVASKACASFLLRTDV